MERKNKHSTHLQQPLLHIITTEKIHSIIIAKVHIQERESSHI